MNGRFPPTARLVPELKVADFERSLAFYVELAGFEILQLVIAPSRRRGKDGPSIRNSSRPARSSSVSTLTMS